jgi:acetolactate synthase-1/2/3 large subunit
LAIVKETVMATEKVQLNRRGFLKSAAAGAAGAAALGVPVAPPVAASAQLAEQARSTGTTVTPEQAARGLASETAPLPDEREVLTVADPGSDFMVDVLKTLDFEYIAANPASSFRGLHESLISYGGNKAPEWLTCCHEEAAVNMANGYYAVAGKPMAVITFAPSGLQHAAMGIFGAFSGHSPTYILVSNIADGKERRPLYDWGAHAGKSRGRSIQAPYSQVDAHASAVGRPGGGHRGGEAARRSRKPGDSCGGRGTQ